MATLLQVAILGSVEARVNGDVVRVPAGKQRALLALLAVRSPHPVSAESAAEALWPRAAPAEALRSVHVTVSRLRRSLGGKGSPLETVAAGYRLAVEADAIDARRFETLVDAARAARVEGDTGPARGMLDEALALWRGSALADVAYESFAQAEIARLEELRVVAIEERIDARLAQGEQAFVVAELEQLAATHPWRERLVGLLMQALYRCGRQADALEVYARGRQRLDDELGLEPSRELRRLQEAILRHDPSLREPPGAPAVTTWTARGMLPSPPNRTIGRTREIAVIGERLRSDSVRLLTLTGPGGVGKTRLALEGGRAIEADFRNGAYLVSLAPIQRARDVPAAVVAALGIIVLSGESPADAVKRFLATKQLLLVVDNFEQLLDAAPFICALLAACPQVVVLATSREPLALAAEERYPVSPLALPPPGTREDPETLAVVDSIALFNERARAHDPDFGLDSGNAAAVAEVCRRVDGLPLAIELAAARCGLLTPREIAERLDASLAALAVGPRDAPARQQTLRATIDWSHELLSDHEKACFAHFAVFAGGATVAAAETITGAELNTLDRLVAKSLLVRHQHAHTPTRLGMLETVRAYAGERFASTADRDAVDERHYRYYRALAEHHGSEQALCGRDGGQHLAQLDADIDNLHAALGWAVQEPDAARAAAMVAALGPYWRMRDRWSDALNWIDRALSIPGTEQHPEFQVQALCTKHLCLWPLGRGAEESDVLAEAEAIAATLADPVILSQTLQRRARVALDQSPAAAEAFAEQALRCATTAGDPWQIASASMEKAFTAPTITELRERVDRAAALLDEVGNAYLLAAMLAGTPYVALCMGGDRAARELADRALPIVRELGTPFQWMILCGNLGLAALMTGDTERATPAFREQLTLCRELVVLPMAAEGLHGLGALAAVRGDDHRAARLAGAATAHRYNQPYDAFEVRLDATLLEPARARVGAHAWDAAFQQGITLSFEAAIADALGEPHA